MFWGPVIIDRGVLIGNNCVIGRPAVEDLDRRTNSRWKVTRIGRHAKIGSNVVIHNGSRLGKNVLIDDACIIGSDSIVGDRTCVYYGARVYWRVRIGRRCIVSGFCCDRSVVKDGAIMMGKLIHKLADPKAPWESTHEPSPKIEKGACVGMDSLVIGGITVGANSYVAAGAIVTKHVKPRWIVVGGTHYKRSDWPKLKQLKHKV